MGAAVASTTNAEPGGRMEKQSHRVLCSAYSKTSGEPCRQKTKHASGRCIFHQNPTADDLIREAAQRERYEIRESAERERYERQREENRIQARPRTEQPFDCVGHARVVRRTLEMDGPSGRRTNDARVQIDDLEASLQYWTGRLDNLLIQNWRLDKLLAEGRCKPNVWLAVKLTQKGNLVLEWFPFQPMDYGSVRAKEHDFCYFTHERGIFEDPFNRILFIKNFTGANILATKPLDHESPARIRAAAHFIAAAKAHFEDVIDQLEVFVNVVAVTRNFDYRSVEEIDDRASPYHRLKHFGITEVSWFDPAERAAEDAERAAQERARWEAGASARREEDYLTTLRKALSCPLEHVVQTYLAHASDPNAAAAALRSQDIRLRRCSIHGNQVSNIIRRLKEICPVFASEHLPKDPEASKER